MTKTIVLKVKNDREPDGWEEEYTIHENDHEAWARKTIQNYNSSLRTGEIPRELVSVNVIKDSKKLTSTLPHTWQKTNLITVRKKGQVYDEFICEKCGITGKRHGFAYDVKHDHQFQKRKYDYCPG